MTTLSTATFFQLQEEERYRLARALMDGPGQILANTLVELEHSIPLIQTDPGTAENGLSALREEIRAGLAQLKSFVAELQPPLLAEMGLGPSLRQYVENFGAKNRIEAECIGYDTLRERLPSTIETAIFRIVQEALSNVSAHSGATRVQVRIARVGDQLRLVVQDNGHGFGSNDENRPKARQLGLVAMRDRAHLVGGQLQVFSEAGQGARVVVTVPYHAGSETAKVDSGGRNENGRKSENGRKKVESGRPDQVLE